ncbi:MFS transporter [Nesterenkonia rhizosphaerae]|uniref:MFS transporter n=1 Tax=Nesterenkonia rhizosphaerae TaxID=1348272 RepID=A0ABP9GD72_9MICC
MEPATPAPQGPMSQPGFLRFWSSGTLTFFGLSVTTIAVDALIINVLEASEAQVGIIRAAQFLPYLLVGLVAGALIDRWRRKPVLVWSTLGTGMALGLVPLMWWLGHLSLPGVGAALFIAGTFGVFTAAAQQATLPRLVSRNQLVSANARIGQAMTVAQTSGPPLGGAATSFLGAPLSIAGGAAAYLASALVYACVPIAEPQKDARAAKPRLWTDIRDGMRFLYRHRTLRPLALSTHTWFLANSAAVTVFALFALRHLDLPALLYGATLAIAGLAALGGALIAPFFGRKFGEGNTVIGARLTYPAAWALVLLAPDNQVWGLTILCLAQALYGFCMGFEDPNEMGYCQAATPAHLLGRMHATMRAANRTMAVLGALLGGALAGLVGYYWTLSVIVGVFTLAGLIAALSPLRGSRS